MKLTEPVWKVSFLNIKEKKRRNKNIKHLKLLFLPSSLENILFFIFLFLFIFSFLSFFF